MTASRPSVREARPSDVAKFSPFMLPVRFAGVAVEEAGEVIGIGIIVAAKGRAYLTMGWTDALKAHPFLIHRTTLMVIGWAKKVGLALHTIEQSDEPGAPRWLAKLGFKDTGERLNGERVLLWTGE